MAQCGRAEGEDEAAAGVERMTGLEPAVFSLGS